MKRYFIIILILLSSLLYFAGCSKKIVGESRANIAPTVEFVNIPVEGAKFSSDTTIYWYGTDVDGFIKYFKYAVVESTTVGSDPLAYITATPDSMIPWVTVEVTLTNPGTKQKVKMSADFRDPVRKYVASYIFLMAVDNLDARSWPPAYRMFRKNNHFPDTRINANQLFVPYVNAKSSSGAVGGINVTLVGSDKIDYPRNPPPFDFHWKLYGPYDSLEMVDINNNFVENIFLDIYGDFYYRGDTLQILSGYDTTIVGDPPDTTIDTIYNEILVDTLKAGNAYGSWLAYFKDTTLTPDLNRLVEESYNPLTGDNWIQDTRVDIYDIFRNQRLPPSADTTRLQYFLIWSQSRDDSRVQDPVPAYIWVSAIEPKFEREAIVLDATNYGLIDGGNFNWPKMPGIYWGREGESFTPSNWPTTVKDVYANLINSWKPGSFDAENILPPDTVCTDPFGKCATYIVLEYTKYRCTQDYFALAPLISAPEQGVGGVSLRDILKHKKIILIKDSPWGIFDFDRSLEGQFIRKGIYAGMSAWSMVRNPFGLSFTDIYGLRGVPTTYAQTFGVQLMNVTAWEGFATHDYNRLGWSIYGPSGQIRIEDFIGALSLVPNELPDISIDTLLLENRYVWLPGFDIFNFPFRWSGGDKMLTGAYPEVGYVEKLFGAEALYLYNSKYGDSVLPIVPVPYAHASNSNDSLRVGNIVKYQGAVVATRYSTPLFRTAHSSFTMLPFDSVTAQQSFNSMMDWLSVQPYLTTGIPASSGGSFDLGKLRRTDREMDEEANQGLLGRMVPRAH